MAFCLVQVSDELTNLTVTQPIMIQSAKFISNAVAMARLPFLIFEDSTPTKPKKFQRKASRQFAIISHSGRF